MFNSSHRWIRVLIFVNFVINFVSLFVIGVIIKLLTNVKKRLDEREPSDSNYISDVFFFYACLVTAFGFLMIILEFLANVLLFAGLGRVELPRCRYMFFMLVTFICTILVGIAGCFVLYVLGDATFEYLAQIRDQNEFILIIPWGIRIIYAIFVMIVVYKCNQVGRIEEYPLRNQ